MSNFGYDRKKEKLIARIDELLKITGKGPMGYGCFERQLPKPSSGSNEKIIELEKKLKQKNKEVLNDN